MLNFITVVFLSVFMIQSAHTEGLKIVMLGTGNPMSNPDRSGPGVAIISGGKSYIVDSGAGIVRRAVAAARAGTPELSPPNLQRIFLTHLHSDHTAGLANMILAPWVLRRTEPIQLFGPPGSKHLADTLILAYRDDINMRINGAQPANPNGYKVNTTEFTEGGKIFEDENIIVEAIPNNHGTWEFSFGYKFTEKSTGKMALVSGDTAYSKNIEIAAKGVDFLVHEMLSMNALNERSPDWQKYHQAFHISPLELIKLTDVAKPKLLILYHQQYWKEKHNDHANEIRAAGYKGKVVSANDLDVFE